MEATECPGCRGNDDEDSRNKKPHIRDLCPADRDKIAQLVKKLAECTQARQNVEAELGEIRAKHESLINRCDADRAELENERSILKQQLASAISREKYLKLESSRSLSTLADQLGAQEKEFARLTETVKDLLREKIQLQNALIERESKIRIAQSKLERAKESFEMEKLMLIKERTKDSIIRKHRNCETQTIEAFSEQPINRNERPISEEKILRTRIKSKNDLDDPSGDGLLLRSLFFSSSSPFEDEHLFSFDVFNPPILK